MLNKQIKINEKISFDDAKKFYLQSENEERVFLDLFLILGVENVDYDSEVTFNSKIMLKHGN